MGVFLMAKKTYTQRKYTSDQQIAKNKKRRKRLVKGIKKVAKAGYKAGAAMVAGPSSSLIPKVAKKVGKRISCVEKGKKRGLSHREAVKFCAGGKVPGKLKAKSPSKIRRSK